MPKNSWPYGPESPRYLARYGGPTRVAAVLTELGYAGRPVSRQAAYSLWKHRRSNGFPDRVRVEVANGSWLQLFDLDEVRAWAVKRIAADDGTTEERGSE